MDYFYLVQSSLLVSFDAVVLASPILSTWRVLLYLGEL